MLLSVPQNRIYGKLKQFSMFSRELCSTMSPNSLHLLNCREFQSIFIFISFFTTFNISSITADILVSTCKSTHRALLTFTITNSTHWVFRNNIDKWWQIDMQRLLTWQMLETSPTNTINKESFLEFYWK